MEKVKVGDIVMVIKDTFHSFGTCILEATEVKSDENMKGIILDIPEPHDEYLPVWENGYLQDSHEWTFWFYDTSFKVIERA